MFEYRIMLDNKEHSSQLGRFRQTSNLVCIKEVTIRTTFSHMINKLASLKKKQAMRGQHHYFQIVYRI